MPELIGLDFETYGSVNLPVHGLDRYTQDKHFTPLIGSFALYRSDSYIKKVTLNFVSDRRGSKRELGEALHNRLVCAHNASFEQNVLDVLGLHLLSTRFIDSAMVARAAGGGSSLAAAAPQLLNVNKMEEGRDLIKLFSIPGKYQEANDSLAFDPQIIADYPDEWLLFIKYCELDAELSLRLVTEYLPYLSPREPEYQAITMDMNRTGWCVDVPLVEEMQRRYLENVEEAVHTFRTENDAVELNLNSLKQLKEWCADRGIRATSFDEKNVTKLLARLDQRIEEADAGLVQLSDERFHQYCQVIDMLKAKQALGGSSLKKLQVILDTATPDAWHPGRYRLRDQYIHCGAGQTLRTTGRSTQMQNLKRLGAEPADMSELEDPDVVWDNDQLAENLRQSFTATDPNGRLIVGDFSSVESRGLAYLAGEQWKLDAFKAGKDLYKVGAAKIYDVSYDNVTKQQRQTGKVGELSCGYGAGADAVSSFAEGMGVTFAGGEAAKLVSDWRAANTQIVHFWGSLDVMLHAVVEGRALSNRMILSDSLVLQLKQVATPDSLVLQHPGAKSIALQITGPQGLVLTRYFHGCYVRGKNICYYRPSDRKTGDLWKSSFIDPKTKQRRWYSIYGGKLAGILTQSFCREIFFRSLAQVHTWAQHYSGQVALVGQFHDEIVIDWKPGAISLDQAKADIEQMMSDPGEFRSFPLAAEIKDDYRYTK